MIAAARRTSDRLRVIRVLEALERMGTDDARRLLEELASGAPAALQSREAKASLDRLTR